MGRIKEIQLQLEDLKRELKQLKDERDLFASVVKLIATDSIELSWDKVVWQRNDWRKRAARAVEMSCDRRKNDSFS